MTFLEEVRTYKSITTIVDRGKKQEEIISKYLEKTSHTFLNLSQQVYESEYCKIKNGYGQLDLFEKVESVVKHMVCSDTFKRFSEWSSTSNGRGSWSE